MHHLRAHRWRLVQVIAIQRQRLLVLGERVAANYRGDGRRTAVEWCGAASSRGAGASAPDPAGLCSRAEMEVVEKPGSISWFCKRALRWLTLKHEEVVGKVVERAPV